MSSSGPWKLLADSEGGKKSAASFWHQRRVQDAVNANQDLAALLHISRRPRCHPGRGRGAFAIEPAARFLWGIAVGSIISID